MERKKSLDGWLGGLMIRNGGISPHHSLSCHRNLEELAWQNLESKEECNIFPAHGE